MMFDYVHCVQIILTCHVLITHVSLACSRFLYWWWTWYHPCLLICTRWRKFDLKTNIHRNPATNLHNAHKHFDALSRACEEITIILNNYQPCLTEDVGTRSHCWKVRNQCSPRHKTWSYGRKVHCKILEFLSLLQLSSDCLGENSQQNEK